MILFHFCQEHLLPGILKAGLTLGVIPVFNFAGIRTVNGFQWLTKNKTFNQVWCEYSNLPYDRTAVRISVKIPKTEQKKPFAMAAHFWPGKYFKFLWRSGKLVCFQGPGKAWLVQECGF